MIRSTLVIAAFCSMLMSAAGASEANEGLRSLFNGADLSGWRGRPHLSPYEEAGWTDDERRQNQAKYDAELAKHWSVDGGEIVNDGQGPYLTTRNDYGDFELRLSYRTVALADSGIYLRATPQVQIWDTTEIGGKWHIGADKGSGGLWNNQRHMRFPLVHADRPFGEWNELVMRLVGSRATVTLNDRLVVDHVVMENFWDRSRPLPRTGPVQLQTHGGEIRFKDLYIRDIGSDEANDLLSRHADDGFESIFNGRDLRGWAGPVDNYVVEDGAIKCRPGKGGTVYTEEEYGDFVVRFEFKLPPGGNNGLAIRYPGNGDTAYQGMCELQVLDNTAEKYKNLKEWQYHGSAYGMVPARRGYQRPVGEWNFQEVTVIGSTVKIELNGNIILDADLSAIDRPASGREHPGRTRTSGHFGFAGHNDPVMFRDVRIKRLD